MNEKIIDIVDGLELYSMTALIRYVAIFTTERIIFLKTAGNWSQAIFGVVSELASGMKNEDALAQLKSMSVEQIIKTDYEKIIINKTELDSVELSEWPVIFRSKVVVRKNSKKYTFKMTKGIFKKFQNLFFSLQKGVIEKLSSPQNSPSSPASAPEKKKSIGIKIIGILIIVVAVLATLGALVSGNIVGIIGGLIFLVDGILLVKMKRWGFYILSLYFFVTLANLFSDTLLITRIIALVIVGGIVIYIWSQRKVLS